MTFSVETISDLVTLSDENISDVVTHNFQFSSAIFSVILQYFIMDKSCRHIS